MAYRSMRAVRSAGLFVVLAVLPVLYHCASLTPLTPGVCGNGVVDPGEDCDAFADATAHEACGAPGTGPLACRFTCAQSAECPNGYNCGSDLVCRAPSGAYQPLGAPLSVGAAGVTLADFNGDGLADALTHGPLDPTGSSHVQVSYLSAAGGLLGSFVVSDRLGSPAVADLNGDGLADLVATLESEQAIHSGVTVFLGQPTNTLASTSFPATSVPSGITAIRALSIPGFVGGPRSVYFVTGTSGYQTGLYLPAGLGAPVLSTSPATGTFLALNEGPDVVVGDVQLAAIVPNESCPDLVYAVHAGGGDFVRIVYGLCIQGSSPLAFGPQAMLATVTLPAGESFCASWPTTCGPGVLVGDVNGDGMADLVASLTATGAPVSYETYVVDNANGGSFGVVGSPNVGGSFDGSPFSVILDGETFSLGATLAVGDVNEDGVVDFVTTPFAKNVAPQGVTLLVSAGPRTMGTPTFTMALPVLGWQTAVFGDFNGDGRLGVAGGSLDSDGIDYYATTLTAVVDPDAGSTTIEKYSASHFTVSTSGGVSNLRVGDYDGDGISDLAFSELDAANDGTVDLAIAYGSPVGALTAPYALGHYAGITQVVAAAGLSEVDVIATALGTTSLRIDDYTTSSGGRPPLSSLSLRTTSGSTREVAFVAVPGAFGQGALPTLAAFGHSLQSGSDNFWYLPTSKQGSSVGVGPLALTSTTISNFDPSLAEAPTANQAVLLAASPLLTGKAASLVAVSSAGADGTETSLLALKLSGSPAQLSPTNLLGDGTAPVVPKVSIAEDGQLGLADLDGDGSADLILLTGTGDVGTCSLGSRARSLVVLWGDGKEGFSLASKLVVAECSSGCTGAPSSSCPEAFATVTNAAAGPAQLAFVTRGSVSFARLGGRSLLGVSTPSLPTPRASDGGATDASIDAGGALPSGVTGWSGISFGDINGDGVTDLALTANGDLYLLEGVPVNK